MQDDSAMERINRIKSAIRQKETPLNTSGKDNTQFCARPQEKNVSRYTSRNGHPDRK
jgi:hypothetical protein